MKLHLVDQRSINATDRDVMCRMLSQLLDWMNTRHFRVDRLSVQYLQEKICQISRDQGISGIVDR